MEDQHFSIEETAFRANVSLRGNNNASRCYTLSYRCAIFRSGSMQFLSICVITEVDTIEGRKERKKDRKQ
jgi:hypothetical protein